jgi:hypothetical protein
MTYPIFSVKFLLKKGLSYCKMVAKELGITNPEGDKRQVLTWADAIVAHQTNLQPVAEIKQQVIIQFQDGLDSCDLAGYSVLDLDGNTIRDGFRTYLSAESWASSRFDIFDQQSIAQQELIEQIETQIQEQIQEQVVIREIDFAYSEVICITPNGVEVLATIIHDLDTENWEVQLKARFESFLTYAEAEAFALNYIDDERGSGRINLPPAIESMGYTIECNYIVDPLGQRYTVRLKGGLVGSIWLNENLGWTLNGFDFLHSPIDAAMELAQLVSTEESKYVRN